jgi:hypothetical protein
LPRRDPGGVTETRPFAAVRETHIGVVFLVGDRAYKLKKPVNLVFLDFIARFSSDETSGPVSTAARWSWSCSFEMRCTIVRQPSAANAVRR